MTAPLDFHEHPAHIVSFEFYIALGVTLSELRLNPTTPKAIDDQLILIIKHLGLDASKFVRLPFAQPNGFNPEPDYCHFNTWLQTRSSGGGVQAGWVLFQDQDNSFAEAIFHSVWVSPSGELQDVTPRRDLEDEVLFVPDPSRAITLATYNSSPAIKTFQNFRVHESHVLSPAEPCTVVLQGDFVQRQGLWPW